MRPNVPYVLCNPFHVLTIGILSLFHLGLYSFLSYFSYVWSRRESSCQKSIQVYLRMFWNNGFFQWKAFCLFTKVKKKGMSIKPCKIVFFVCMFDIYIYIIHFFFNAKCSTSLKLCSIAVFCITMGLLCLYLKATRSFFIYAIIMKDYILNTKGRILE